MSGNIKDIDPFSEIPMEQDPCEGMRQNIYIAATLSYKNKMLSLGVQKLATQC